MDGVIVVKKEKDYTSRDVVNIVGKILGTKKIGHTGTLDPMATGVLVLVVGRATKLVDYLTSTKKEYIADILLGVDTDTLDMTGTILKEEECIVTEEEIKSVLNDMTHTYLQEVPKYSAVKVNGKKLYEYARKNEDVVLPKKEVTIYDLNLIGTPNVKDIYTTFQIQTSVSKGTYIRSLIRDIAAKLNTVGVMTALVRTKQGNFCIEDSVTIKQINNGNYKFIPIKEILKELPMVEVSDDLEKYIRNGNKIKNSYGHDQIAFIKGEEVIALYEVSKKDKNELKPKIMF